MKVLILGSGAAEHALALSLSFSEHISKIYCIPGNPGIAQIAECVPISLDQFSVINNFAQEKSIDLVIPVDKSLIINGITDYLDSCRVACFSPTKDSAQLEWSKYFAKEFMLRREIPSPRYAAFDRREFALAYAGSQHLPVLVKANGLTYSKGISVIHSYERAHSAINACFDGAGFDKEASNYVIIEEFIQGSEFSITIVCDGQDYAILPSVKKFNRLLDGNTGSLTEGLGALSPHPEMSARVLNQIEEEIIQPIIWGLAEEGRPYTGFLNIELIIDEEKQPYVIDFNCSLDPLDISTSSLLLECDLFEVILQAARGDISYFSGALPSAEQNESAVSMCAMMCAQGYPGKTASNLPIRFQIDLSMGQQSQILEQSGLLNALGAKFLLYHNNTALDHKNNLITKEGRVLCGATIASNYHSAKKALYEISGKIDFPSKHMRYDIGS